ncbi:MAG: hypothetical protein A2W03_09250 [Candidatus Aminicenantes bacterium RBG_16_63_16]|nr:MAG: hypothetical protein A2W03_09250 [Candidatus Aminicenantes bacterium RBG_16_63_16]
MAVAKPFTPAKLVVGVIAGETPIFEKTEGALVALYGPIDLRSGFFPFDATDYYDNEMGPNLRRRFLSFVNLVAPDELAAIKLRTNALEDELGRDQPARRRAVNIDPGIMTPAALIMGTAKDFAHRVPLTRGIYAHLELLFRKDEVRFLDWTYPDFRRSEYGVFFLEVRAVYLEQLRRRRRGPGTG